MFKNSFTNADLYCLSGDGSDKSLKSSSIGNSEEMPHTYKFCHYCLLFNPSLIDTRSAKAL